MTKFIILLYFFAFIGKLSPRASEELLFNDQRCSNFIIHKHFKGKDRPVNKWKGAKIPRLLFTKAFGNVSNDLYGASSMRTTSYCQTVTYNSLVCTRDDKIYAQWSQITHKTCSAVQIALILLQLEPDKNLVVSGVLSNVQLVARGSVYWIIKNK